MKISEILQEDGQQLELRDVVRSFPNTYAKVFRAKWGGHQLSYHGQPLFDGEHGLYHDIAEAVESFAKNEVELEFSYAVDPNELGFHELDVTIKIDDVQEVYLGYHAADDTLYMGLDMWIGEDDFNNQFDEQFEKQTGEEFNSDNPKHAEIFDDIWQQHKEKGFGGGLFSVSQGSRGWDVDEVMTSAGGFYAGIHRSSAFKQLNLIDLRLD